MPAQSILTQDRLKELLHYNPDTGVFRWKNTKANNVKRGDVAGTLSQRDGYIMINIYYLPRAAHRLAFLYMTGELPKDCTDHINHVRNDNRWINLRCVNRQENCKNKSITKRNTSGHVGVGWNKAAKKWVANISVNNKTKYLGLFSNIKNAIMAREKAKIEYNYHPNHA